MTAKPDPFAANVAEDDLADDGASNPHVAKSKRDGRRKRAQKYSLSVHRLNRNWQNSEEEKKEYLDDLGVESSGLDKLVAASYSILGLISFLTAGEDECRAWTIRKGHKRHHRQQVRSIQTLSVDLSRLRL